MKSLKFARIAAVALAAAASSAAFAAGSTQSLVVNATVTGACLMNAIPAMNFTLDPTVGTNQTATSTVQYKCTNGTTPTIFTVGGSSTGSLTGSLANGALTMPIAFSWTQPTTAGSGLGAGVTPISVIVTGSILGTDYVNAAAGTYTQTISVTVAP